MSIGMRHPMDAPTLAGRGVRRGEGNRMPDSHDPTTPAVDAATSAPAPASAWRRLLARLGVRQPEPRRLTVDDTPRRSRRRRHTRMRRRRLRRRRRTRRRASSSSSAATGASCSRRSCSWPRRTRSATRSRRTCRPTCATASALPAVGRALAVVRGGAERYVACRFSFPIRRGAPTVVGTLSSRGIRRVHAAAAHPPRRGA